MKKRKVKVTIGIFGGKLLMKYNVETKKNEKKKTMMKIKLRTLHKMQWRNKIKLRQK